MSQKLPKAIRPEEYPQIIKEIKKKPIKVAFILAYESGMRVSEITALKAIDVSHHIHIEQGKGKKDRTVPLPKHWRKEYLSLLPLKVSNRTLQRQFAKIRDKLNLNPQYTFHSLRHGFATRMMEQGAPLSHIQVLLGHSSISTTNVYTKANPIDALKSYENLF